MPPNCPVNLKVLGPIFLSPVPQSPLLWHRRESCFPRLRSGQAGQAPRRRDPASLILSYFPGSDLVSLSQIAIEARIDTQCKLWYTSQRRNPDHDAHKDALLVSIQAPSLAAGDLNALGIGSCAWAEPILYGSALAFLTLGALLNKKRQPVPERERCRLACWSPGKNIQTTWRECMVFSLVP